MRANFLVYKYPNFGRCEKSKKGISIKRRAFSFLLKRETQGRLGSSLTKCRFIQIICRVTTYFLSRWLNTVRCSAPVQKKGLTWIKSQCRTKLSAPCVCWVSCRTGDCPSWVGGAKRLWGVWWECCILDRWLDNGVEVVLWGLQRNHATAFESLLRMGWRGGTGGGGRHVDAVHSLSLTMHKGDQAQYSKGRPWHCPLLVERTGWAGPVDIHDLGGSGGRSWVLGWHPWHKSTAGGFVPHKTKKLLLLQLIVTPVYYFLWSTIKWLIQQ